MKRADLVASAFLTALAAAASAGAYQKLSTSYEELIKEAGVYKSEKK